MDRAMRRAALLVVLVAALPACAGAPTNVVSPHPNELVSFSVVLRLPGEGKPDGPISAAEFGRRYGLPLDAVRRVERRLEDAGLEVLGRYPQRTALEVRGRARDVESFFGFRFGLYEDAEGRSFRAPVGQPVVPPDLRFAVAGVASLSTRPVEISGAVPAGGFKPRDLAKAYGVPAGARGRGQTIAVLSFASFDNADIRAFDRATGTKGGRIERIELAGGSDDLTSAVALEAALDLQTVRGMAPGARILHYEHPYAGTLDSFTRGLGAAMDAIVAQGRADVVSISYGICDRRLTRQGEEFLPDADRLRAANAFRAAVAAGMTVFVATQDQGAYTCQRFDFNDHRVSTSWPAGDPNVVAVGGTRLTVESDGTYREETGWEDVLSTFGGGGGLNPSDLQPEWQRGPGVLNSFSNGMRQLPDVAAASDSDSGVFVVFRGRPTIVGGTSAATPFWAGVAALIGEAATRERLGAVPYLNPILYDVGSVRPRSGAFHDVTKGGNRYHSAGPDWDYSTGLGSPNVAMLIREVLAYLRGTSSQG
jgi:subtilase family serine protease